MSELEIKELKSLQDKIDFISNELKRVETSRIHIYTHNNLKCQIYFPNSVNAHALATLPNLTKDVFELICDRYNSQLRILTKKRDEFILCRKETKSVYKPIDILDKE